MKRFCLVVFCLFSLGISAQVAKLNPVTQLPKLLKESSGLAKDSNGIFWSHNDSNNEAKIHGFNSSGKILYTIEVTNASNTDWEDIALVNDTLLVCDCGNNLNTRTDLKILKIPVGNLSLGTNQRAASFIYFSYAEQLAFPPELKSRHFDVEAMVCTSDSIYLFSKNRTEPCDGLTYQYVFPNRLGSYPALKRKGQFNSGSVLYADWITGASLNKNGDLALLSASKIVIYRNFIQNPRIGAVAQIVRYNGSSQLEGICWENQCSVWLTDEDNVLIPNDNKLYSLDVCKSASSSGDE